jgi:CRISPR-associated protein Csx14
MSATHPFREILIFVAGATPQIITETIYALAMQNPPVYADELHIITTTAGRSAIKKCLLQEGHLQSLCVAHDIPIPHFDELPLHVISNDQRIELEDIRTVEDNEAAGDFISNFIQRLSTDPETRLHCSLAGGRKTMSFYIGSALQLFGRPQDRLYHILVSPEFESNPAFFYPPKIDTFIDCRMPDGSIQARNARESVVELAELPCIKLGALTPKEGQQYREMVRLGQHEVDTSVHQPLLHIHLTERSLYIGDRPVELIPVQLMLYAAILRQKVDHCKYQDRQYCRDCTGCYETIVDFSSREALNVMARDYAAIYAGNHGRVDDLLDKWPDGIDTQALRAIISKINRTIREQVADETLIPLYTITTDRKYGSSRYGIKVEKTKIQF